MSILGIVREELRELPPYTAAEQVAETVRLNANEVPFRDPADRFRRPLNRYPEIRPERVRAALAAHYGVAADQLLVTRGSSEAIDLLLRCFCRAGRDNIVTPSPTFSMYRHYARIQDAELRELRLAAETGFRVSAAALLALCDEHTKLVFLCAPNNPTGTELPTETLVAILAALAGKCAVVVDEAYAEFSATASALDLLARYDNLVVLRTLSKAMGFAGVRCGVAIASPDVVRVLNAVQAPYALATPVTEWVEDALTPARIRSARNDVARLVAERERVAAALAALPCVRAVHPSGANFLLVQVTAAAAVLEQTRSDGILVRHFGGDLADCVRITIGAPAENDALLASLEAVQE